MRSVPFLLGSSHQVLDARTPRHDCKPCADFPVVSSQSEALAQTPHFPLCLLTTKSLPDVLPTTKLLEPCIYSRQIGAYSLIQNGLGVERALYEAVKDQGCPVMGGMAWIGVMTRDEGRVVEWRGPVSLLSARFC